MHDVIEQWHAAENEGRARIARQRGRRCARVEGAVEEQQGGPQGHEEEEQRRRILTVRRNESAVRTAEAWGTRARDRRTAFMRAQRDEGGAEREPEAQQKSSASLRRPEVHPSEAIAHCGDARPTGSAVGDDHGHARRREEQGWAHEGSTRAAPAPERRRPKRCRTRCARPPSRRRTRRVAQAGRKAPARQARSSPSRAPTETMRTGPGSRRAGTATSKQRIDDDVAQRGARRRG